jgi:hypothetical protein
MLLTVLAHQSKHRRTPMRRSLTLLTALTAVTCLPTANGAQSAPELARKPASGTTSTGEEAASAVDPAVLDRCRQQADNQKLKEGSERKAFMGTYVTPEH